MFRVEGYSFRLAPCIHRSLALCTVASSNHALKAKAKQLRGLKLVKAKPPNT